MRLVYNNPLVIALVKLPAIEFEIARSQLHLRRISGLFQPLLVNASCPLAAVPEPIQVHLYWPVPDHFHMRQA